MNDRVNRHKQHQDAKRIAAAPPKPVQKAKPTTCQACRKDAAMQQKPRLPHASDYILSWDAVRGEWGGTLTVTVAGPAGSNKVFAGSSSGVIGLLVNLDDMYRASLTAPASPAPKPTDAPE